MKQLDILIQLKLAALSNSFRRMRSKRMEFLTLIGFLAAASTGLFFFFYYSFRFFRAQEPFGPILVDEAFYLFNFALFIMFLISTGVSAYTSLFRSPEVPFLITKPVHWTEVYFIKLTEALWYSSWSFLFIAVPFMTAYGMNKHASPVLFAVLCVLFYVPFVILAGMLGTLISTILVWLLPTKRRRFIVFAAAAFALSAYFAHIEPHLVKEQGSIAGVMSGYLPHVAFAKNPMLPSSWLTSGLLAFSGKAHDRVSYDDGMFYLLLLLSNTFFFLIPSYSAAARIYPAAFYNCQDHGEARKIKRVRTSRVFEKFFDALNWPSRPALAFLEKDLKTFARDPAEWSQLLIFFGLLLLYFANLKNLEFNVLKDFWRNLVFSLNTIGTYIVLSSFSMRFVFPMLSLEGSRAWMIGMAPMRFSSLLLEKFFLGTIISMLLTMPLVFFSGWMLEIPLRSVIYTTGLGFFVCVALTGLSVGMGARFPNFKTNNPSEIISGFGGSMLLVTHLFYLTLIGVFLILSRQGRFIMFATMAAGSLLTGMLPLHMGVKALRKMEF